MHDFEIYYDIDAGLFGIGMSIRVSVSDLCHAEVGVFN